METTKASSIKKPKLEAHDSKPKKNSKKRGKKKGVIIGAIVGVVLVTLGVLAWIFLPGIIGNKEPEEDENAILQRELDNCLSEANKYIDVVESYKAQIKCHEEHKTDSSEDKIASLKSLMDHAEFNTCINKANTDYSVTQDEIDRAIASGIAAQNKLTAKMVDGYNAQINCYKNHPNELGSEQKISELEKNRNELQSANSSLNAAYNNSSSSSSSSSSNSHSSSNNNTQQNSQPVSQGPSCEEYYAKYNAEYSSATASIMSRYSSAIANARNSCSSFGGCPAASNLERQRDAEIAQEKAKFQQNLTNVGCGSYYDQ